MSTDTDIVDTALSDSTTFDPFDGCPWGVYLNRLSEAYMTRERGSFVPLGEHHINWLERFADGEDFALLAHRFGLKTFVVLAYIAARLQYDDGFTALWVTNTEDQAKDKAHREFNKLTNRAPFLDNLAENVRVEDTIKTKRFPNGSAFHAGWLHGGLEGARADLIVFDDLIKEKGDGDTEEIWQWCAGAAMPIGKRNSQEVFIGTRKRPGDLYQYIADETDYQITEYPLIRERWLANQEQTVGKVAPERYYTEIVDPLSAGDRTVSVLWPDARGPAFIQDKYGKTGERMFNRAYCLVVGNREGLIYDGFSRSEHTFGTETPDDAVDALAYYFNALDWGSGHPAGLLQLARGDDGLYVLDEEKAAADGTDFYTNTLSSMWRDFGRGVVACDPSDKRGINDLRSEGIDAIGAENDVDAGIREVQGLIAAGELHIHESCTELLDELGKYRYNQKTGRPVKANDHLVDALRYGVMAERDVIRPHEKQRQREADEDRGGVTIY
jgi:hypothetical protein